MAGSHEDGRANALTRSCVAVQTHRRPSPQVPSYTIARFWRLTAVCTSLGLVMLGGCDAFRAHTVVVARAGGHELTVDRLGEIVAHGKVIPLQRDVVERMAGLWVDYSLLAQRLADGDSLLDSVTVVNSLWAETQQQIVTHYHSQLVGQYIEVTDAMVDSVYQAGDHRLIYHILIRTSADMSDTEREAKWNQAARLRMLAMSGATGWERANQENEDSVARVEGGSLGVIARGETVPAFENAAFSLDPGQTSDLVESQYGFHVARRPELVEVREAFADRVRNIFIERMNFVFIREVDDRWELEVRSDAPDRMRRAAADPANAKKSKKVLGTYLGGKFTVSDLARWLHALPPEYTAEVTAADDEQLLQFVRGLIRNNVLEQEARDSGHELTQEDLATLRETLAQDITQLRQVMGLDSALALAGSEADRSQAVGGAVDNYLAAITNDLAQLAIVPPFLAEELRKDMDWDISASGINRALDRGARMRAGLSAQAAPAAAGSADSGSGGDQ